MATFLPKKALTFDDVHLVPAFSDIESRSREIDLSVRLNNTDIVLATPFIASPMDTVSGPEMAIAINRNAGGLAILHRYCTIEAQAESIKQVLDADCDVGAAVGVNGDCFDRAKALVTAGCRILCIDVAHGHHSLMQKALKTLREQFPRIHIMAGNVATSEGFNDLSSWGADSIRINIGSGSICSSRTQTGHGYPALQTILDTHSGRTNKTQIISDGGIKQFGDIVKALAAGADMVMMGSMFAGTDEAPGVLIETSKGMAKTFRGMASPSAQEEWRGFHSSNEGISTTVPYKGAVAGVLTDMINGVKSGLSYSGARTIPEFQKKAIFAEVSHASAVEATTHILNR